MSDEAGFGLARLRQLVRREGSSTEAAAGCDLCAEPLPDPHRHLLDLDDGTLLCVCRACRILFDREESGGDRYRLIPERYVHLPDFELSDDVWAGLRIPVATAFFFHSTPQDRVMAVYPSPMGPTESTLELDTWGALLAANPILLTLQPDVEALLVHRAREADEHWVVPVDACYRLVGIVRTHWQGLAGGEEVWARIEAFFRELHERAGPTDPERARGPGTRDADAMEAS